MILPIYLYGHPVLRTPTELVTPDTPGLDELIANMKETMYASDGIGIAAPQVGILRRVVVIDVGEGLMELVNPRIVEADGEQFADEGCLSIPG